MRAVLGTLRVSLVLLLVPAPAQAAGPFEPRGDDDPALVAAWTAWEKKGIDDYRTRVKLSCFCLESPVVRTTVRNGTVRAVRQGGQRLAVREGYSMDMLFAKIRDAQASADSVTVKYTARGVPTSIGIDPSKMAADEESYFSVSLIRR